MIPTLAAHVEQERWCDLAREAAAFRLISQTKRAPGWQITLGQWLVRLGEALQARPSTQRPVVIERKQMTRLT